MAEARWPALSINLGAETEATLESVADQVAVNQVAIAALQADSSAHVLRAGDSMGGALGFVSGTVSAPGLFVVGDPNSGLFRSPAQLRVTVDGVEVAQFNNFGAGNVNFRVTDGSATRPSPAFISDVDTGPFLAAAGVYAISVSAVERMRVDTAGIKVAAGDRYGFADDTDTYIDSDAADRLRFVTGGAEQARINAQGVELVAGNRFGWSADTDTYLSNPVANTLGHFTGGTERLRIANTAISANDGSSGLTEIFPKPYIAAATNRSATDIVNISSAGQVGREITVACEYANQLIMVQVTIDCVWINVPDGEQVLIRPYINQTLVGPQAYIETGPGDTDATTSSSTSHSHSHSHLPGTDTLWWESSSSSHVNISVISDTDATTASASHTHSHTHTSGFVSVPLSASAHHETAADGAGNVDIGFFADTQTGTADITENTISYTIWRR